MPGITVVGGGLAGLVAAIECASTGKRVNLLEARERCGGRARSSSPPYIADEGPHAFYPPGPFWAWLKDHNLLPPTTSPRRRGYRLVDADRLTVVSRRYTRAVMRLHGDAPVDTEFRTWAAQKTDHATAQAACSVLIAFTYDQDPGRLSARFAMERFRRLVSPRLKVRYVLGGWQRLVDALVERALSLGVEIQTSTHVRDLPQPPAIIATDPRNAALLLGPDLRQPETGRVAALDVSIRRFRTLPTVVFSLDSPCVAVRHSSVDASISPSGEDLLQLATGFPPDETIDQAVKRMETLLDTAFEGWRENETWQRHYSFDMGAGAVDLPGQTWRDRPPGDYGDGVFLAGDWVAAPGILSETAFITGREAARGAAALAS
jgi:phytoene dehydrogenase-like protein